MWRHKRLFIISVITVVVLGGTLGGFAMANADSQSSPPVQSVTLAADDNPVSALLDKIATIYEQKTGQTLDTQALLDSLKQAQQEIRNDKLSAFLDNLVKNGKITADQAQQYKDWLNAKPDVPLPGPGPEGGPFMGKFGGRIGPRIGGRAFGPFHGWFGPFNNGDNSNTTTTTPSTTN
jgi:hypothetical protein